MHKIDEGTRFVFNTSITFASSIIPIHTELNPSACAAKLRIGGCKG